jgi:hypothetical protein
MKDVYITFSEALATLTPEQKKLFESKRKPNMTVETQLAVIESIKPIKESRGPAKKNNGRTDNGGELLTESANNTITETADGKHRAKSDAAMYKALGISEGDSRRLRGLPPGGETLTPAELREYRFGLAINLSEADALRLAKKV